MASFACFSNSKEKSTRDYKSLIQRFRDKKKREIGDHFSIGASASFSYYTSHKKEKTYTFKDFIYHLRKEMVTGDIALLLCDNPTPIFKCFVRLIERLKLQDGQKACAYYGEIKKIITAFMNYFTYIIDDVVKKIDTYTNTYDDAQLLSLFDNTVEIYELNQAAFLKEYLPLNSKIEEENYAEVIGLQTKYLEDLKKYKERWTGHMHNKVEVFAKEQNFEIAIRKLHALCNFTHTYLSVMLGDRLYEIAVSVSETVDRLNSNLEQYNKQNTKQMNEMITMLYEKNKELLTINRRHKKRSTDAAEVNRTIETITDKILNFGKEEAIARLELETGYWMKRMKDFNEIATIMIKIRTELDHIRTEEDKYKRLRTTELPGSKTMCFDLMGENYQERKIFLEKKLLDTSKALITYFCVRGTDRILYTDNVGSYYCDEFNHQNYITNFGLKFFHVDCYGNFLENFETDPYYFDENGRYTIVNGEKIHQCAPCTSQYKLGDDGTLKKITKDCGHSERITDNCRLEIKDLTDVVILPKLDLIDISGTLDHSAVKYLWDSFGMLLPDVLYQVASAHTKNPIHYMAHLLLKLRFEATIAEYQEMRKKADKYRHQIYEDRKAKAAAERRAWKSKLPKRTKPEDSDDTQEWAAYSQHVADWQYVNSLGYYN